MRKLQAHEAADRAAQICTGHELGMPHEQRPVRAAKLGCIRLCPCKRLPALVPTGVFYLKLPLAITKGYRDKANTFSCNGDWASTPCT